MVVEYNTCILNVSEKNMCEQQHLKELSNFIDSNPDARELKRAMSVMMWMEGMPCSKIQKILNVSATFISQCKMKFIENGVEELKLKYQGSKAYLSQAQRREIINYLDTKSVFKPTGVSGIYRRQV
jgi:putative transposase